MATKAGNRVSPIARARAAFGASVWTEAHAEFGAAERDMLLAPEDLEHYATAAHLLGRLVEADALFVRAHQGFLERGDDEHAARCAFWLGMHFVTTGQAARGSGWLARASRLVEESGRDWSLAGYLLLPLGIRGIADGDSIGALDVFARAIEIGRRFGDAALVALARHGTGRALIRLGRSAEGLTLLDEVMIAVTGNEIPPLVVGSLYCSVIEGCHETFELSRAREWTTALDRMCASQPGLAPYRGHCLVRRAEMMQLHGAWADAMDSATQASELCADDATRYVAASAMYRRADVHRVRGEFPEAEVAFRAAADAGRQPHPGLALLRLAQGQIDSAASAIRSAAAGNHDRATRVHILHAYVEIMLRAGELDAARTAAGELESIATELGTPYPLAVAAQCGGSLLLAEGNAAVALPRLADALKGWMRLDVPYEAARTRALLSLAHRALGDSDAAAIDLSAACATLERLGAIPELNRVNELVVRETKRGETDSLTHREGEVLALIATGKTNRAIASALGISEKTVARHVANIFMKLSLPNRASATAYAFRRGLV